MNAQDRKQVKAILSKLETLKAECETLSQDLTELAEAERAKFDNMSEGLQASDKGQAIEAAADALEEAAGNAEEGDIQASIDALENIEGLND
jgi:uncharacterized protein (UPF0335 family)